MNRSVITSLFFRGSSILLKFLFALFATDALGLIEFGNFSLFNSIVSVGVYVIGLDFYTYAFRELPVDGGDEFYFKLRDSLMLYLFNYAILAILICIFYTFGITFLNDDLIIILLPILFLEHINSELSRILIIINENGASNILIFIKNGLWVLPAMLFASNFGSKRLFFILSLWLFFLLLAFIYGLVFLLIKKPINIKGLFLREIDFGYIKKGLQTSMFFFASSLALKLTFFLDKFFIKRAGFDEELGVYSLFSTISFVLIVLLEVGVVFQFLPNLIKQKEQNTVLFDRSIKRMNTIILLVSTVFSLCMVPILMKLLEFLNFSFVSGNFKMFAMCQLGSFFYGLSLIPHYNLYLNQKDKYILFTSLSGLIIFIISASVLLPFYGVMGVTYAVVIFCLYTFLGKLYFSRFERDICGG